MRNETAARNIHANVGGPATAAQARPPTQVESMLNVLGDSIESLNKQLEVHRDKLSPVTRGEAPASDNAKASPDEVLVPVADRLRTFDRRINSLRLQLESLTDRTEA